MYLVFTRTEALWFLWTLSTMFTYLRMADESCLRQLRYLLLYICYVFRALLTPLCVDPSSQFFSFHLLGPENQLAWRRSVQKIAMESVQLNITI